MRVRIIVRPTGLLNGQEWPAVGQTIDLPKVVAEGMAEAGDVEIVVAQKASEKPTEKRPARQAGVEKRAEKKS